MLSLIVALAAVAAGALAVALVDPETSRWERLAIGAPIGFAFCGLVGLVVSSFAGLGPATATASAALVLAGPVVLYLRRPRALVPPRPATRVFGGGPPLLVYFAAFALLLTVFFAKAAYEKDGAIRTGEWNNLGDLGFHVGIIEGFVKGENFPPEHPEFAGVRLTYPFLYDFTTAQLVAAGAPLLPAMFFQNVLAAVVLLALLYRWAFVLTRDRLAALLAPVIVLFCGGLGFLTLAYEAHEQGASLLGLLLRPPHPVTILWGRYSDVLRWGNSLTTFFLPQRAWLLGLPLALIVWTAWWQATIEKEARARRRRLRAAGVVAGLLPLAHAHSYMVVLAMAGGLALLQRRHWRSWLGFFVAALALGLPQVAWVTRDAGASAGHFFAWHYGWAKPDGVPLSLLSFWIVNTGLTFPLALAAIAWRGDRPVVPRRLLVFLAPFAACLILPNFVKLSPWDWDTNKVLFYGYLAAVLPLSLVLARFFRGLPWMKAAGAFALALLVFSGALDVWRDVSGLEEWTQFDADAVKQAAMIEAATPPRARILSAPSASRPVLLTGRRSLLGHPWTVWSHGLDGDTRAADEKKIFAGDPEADALLAQYAIDYVLVGPAERDPAEMHASEAFFAKFEKAGEAAGATLYKVAGAR